MIRTNLIAICLPTFAFGGAWATFEERCLLPMENVALERPTDLLPIIDEAFAEASLEAFGFPNSEMLLIFSDDKDGAVETCGLLQARFGDSAERWIAQVVEDGRYELLPSEGAHAGVTLRSSDWREPKIEVNILPLGNSDGPALVAYETNLES